MSWSRRGRVSETWSDASSPKPPSSHPGILRSAPVVLLMPGESSANATIKSMSCSQHPSWKASCQTLGSSPGDWVRAVPPRLCLLYYDLGCLCTSPADPHTPAPQGAAVYIRGGLVHLSVQKSRDRFPSCWKGAGVFGWRTVTWVGRKPHPSLVLDALWCSEVPVGSLGV